MKVIKLFLYMAVALVFGLSFNNAFAEMTPPQTDTSMAQTETPADKPVPDEVVAEQLKLIEIHPSETGTGVKKEIKKVYRLDLYKDSSKPHGLNLKNIFYMQKRVRDAGIGNSPFGSVLLLQGNIDKLQLFIPKGTNIHAILKQTMVNTGGTLQAIDIIIERILDHNAKKNHKVIIGNKLKAKRAEKIERMRKLVKKQKIEEIDNLKESITAMNIVINKTELEAESATQFVKDATERLKTIIGGSDETIKESIDPLTASLIKESLSAIKVVTDSFGITEEQAFMIPGLSAKETMLGKVKPPQTEIQTAPTNNPATAEAEASPKIETTETEKELEGHTPTQKVDAGDGVIVIGGQPTDTHKKKKRKKKKKKKTTSQPEARINQ